MHFVHDSLTSIPMCCDPVNSAIGASLNESVQPGCSHGGSTIGNGWTDQFRAGLREWLDILYPDYM